MAGQSEPAAETTPQGARHPRRVIWFCDTDLVAAHPEWLPVLRDEIGLTTLMAEDFTHHTSGFAADPEVADRSPLAGWRERQELLDLHLGKERVERGVYPVVPGILGGVDDTNLRRLLAAADAAGIEVWGHIGLWSYAGEVFPEFSMRDVWGRPPDLAQKRWGIGFCPSKRIVNDWVTEGLVHVTRRYGVAGFMVNHARYPAPASLSAMFSCACPDCAADGRRLGYDVDAIHAAVRDIPERLKRLTPAALQRAVAAGASPIDWLAWLGGSGKEIVGWLELRCRLLAERMAEFRHAVVTARRAGGAVPQPAAARGAAGAVSHPAAARSPALVWGSDVFPPSVAIFGGHHYAQWAAAADYLTGGSSHGGVVGWATAVTNVALEWGRYLCTLVPGLDERTALRLLFRLLGYDDLVASTAPDSAAVSAGAITGHLAVAFQPLDRGEVPVVRIMEREVARLLATAPGRLALYPPIAAGRDLERLERLCQVIAQPGVHGALLSGLRPDDPAQLRAIRAGLGALARS